MSGVAGRWTGFMRSGLAGFVVLLLSAAGLVLSASAASAHAALESVSPADGSTLTKAPTRVVLTFGEDITALGAVVKVTGPGGSAASGSPVISGPKVTQQLSADLASGPYTVTFRVVSADGHPVAGTTTFTLKLPGTARTPPSVTASPSPTVPVVTASPSSSEVDVDGTPLVVDEPTGPGWLGWSIGALVLLALGVGVARARRGPQSKGSSD